MHNKFDAVIFEYKSSYSNSDLRGEDITKRPPLTVDIAKQYGNNSKRLLDIGCGDALKTIQLAPFYAEVVGIEPSFELLKKAQQNIDKANSNNVSVIEGTCELKTLPCTKFDTIINILAFINPKMAHSFLKSEGRLIVEWLGVEDKVNFTKFFGCDTKGWRGANVGKTYNERVQELTQRLSPYFSVETIYDQKWQTKYSKSGLWALLTNTYSTVRDFSPTQDLNSFEMACASLMQDNSMVLTQNRMVIIAKPKT